MKSICLSLVLLGLSAATAWSSVINFDDVDASAGDVSLDALSPYQGFTWTNFTVYTDTPGFPGFNNGIVSSPNAAYTGGENSGAAVTPVVGSISAANPFDFISAYLGSGYYDNLSVTVEGFLGSTMLYSQTVTVSTAGAMLFNFNFTGIDQLQLFASTTGATTDPFNCGSFNCTQFTIDDFTFAPGTSPMGPPTPTGVPEPSTVILCGTALVLLSKNARRTAVGILTAGVIVWSMTNPASAASLGRSSPRLSQMAAQFEEPLVPTGRTTPQQDEAVLRAIEEYRAQAAGEGLSALSRFVADHRDSPWRVAVLTNMGLSWYHYGYFSKAIDAWEQAWREGKAVSDPRAKALVDRALGELMQMHARLGHADRLAALFAETGNRNVTGPATEALTGAREGLWMMRHEPGIAYLCGPMALKNLLLSLGAGINKVQFLDDYRSGPRGVSMAQVSDLADRSGLNHEIVFREPDQPVPVPSIVHWKVNHFAAVVGEENGRFHIQDPTFGSDLWVTRGAIDSESSGYFLVAETGRTPWRRVKRDEAEGLRGMGFTSSQQKGANTPDEVKAQSPCANAGASPKDSGQPNAQPKIQESNGAEFYPYAGIRGMCGYDITEMTVSLNLNDTPVGYAPPKGPPAFVTLTYNQREDSQPATFAWFNISPKWTLNWLSYIQDDPHTAGANVERYVAGGGSVDYAGYNSGTGAFTAETRDASVLVRTSATPITYQRNLADGSREIYSQSNGAVTYPRRVFLTQVIDSFGNTVTLSYDNQMRLMTLTDATGRVTTFSYSLASNPLLVTKITDPFGRSAALAYDGSGRLIQITDVIGLTSQFTYDASSLINSMTTPYGTTNFVYGQSGTTRFLNATDPLGNTERVEFQHTAPGMPYADPAATVPKGMQNLEDAYLYYRNSFYWDKHAYKIAAGNYLKARITHWHHWISNTSETAHSIESIKFPLENRVWFTYPGQPNSLYSGALDKPNAVGRVLDDGTTQLTKISYNTKGNLADIIDASGRETQFVYDANGIDLLQVKQKVSASTYATIRAYTYNAQHLRLTSTDAAGETTSYAYNGAGQLAQITNPLGQTTKFEYDGLGYVTRIVNANNQTQESFTYDSFGHMATRTDSEGYTLSYSYDAFDRVVQVTYPDGTNTQYGWNKLDLASIKDRQGRTTTYAYDAGRNLVDITDPLGRHAKMSYYENGDLKSLTDANNNTVAWDIDLQDRVTAKHYPDGRTFTNTYEATTSRVKWITDSLGQMKQYSYAPDDQLKGLTYLNALNATPNVTFTYDAFFPRLSSMTDGSGTTQYAYVAPGSPGALQLQKEQGPYGNSTVAYAYDALGRIVSRTVDSSAETFSYDNLGRVISHASALGTFDLKYLGQTGQRTGWNIHGGSLGTAWSYDSNTNDRRLKAITNSGATRAYQFTTTPEYNVSQIAETAAAGSAWPPQTWTFTYDASDRVTHGQSSGGPQFLYSYDLADNVTSAQTPTGTRSGSYTTVDQISSFGGHSYSYDANGNVTDDGVRTYTWDADNRLVGVVYKAQPSRTTTFRYDGLGRRIAIVTNGIETRYLWCGESLCQARTAADAAIRRYYPEGEAMPATGALLYYAQDHLGSVRDVVAVQNGSRIAAFDYDPYGMPTNTSARIYTDFRYAGMFYDQQDGLYLTEYRAYDPNAGRWLSRDPSGETSGLNPYAYVFDSPTTSTDPLGLWCWSAFRKSFAESFREGNQSFKQAFDWRGYFLPGAAGAIFRDTGLVDWKRALKSVIFADRFGGRGLATLGIRGTLVSGGVGYVAENLFSAAFFGLGLEISNTLGSAGWAAYEASHADSNCGCKQ